MKQFRNIKLPLQKTQKVRGDDIEMLDALWDMELPEINKVLLKLHVENIPCMMVFTQATFGFVGLFFYRPPDIWIDFDYQQYQIYIAPNFPLFIHYWVERRMKTQDLFEAQTVSNVISYLEQHLNKLKNQSVSHTG